MITETHEAGKVSSGPLAGRASGVPARKEGSEADVEALRVALDTLDMRSTIPHEEHCLSHGTDGVGEPLDCTCDIEPAIRLVERMAALGESAADIIGHPEKSIPEGGGLLASLSWALDLIDIYDGRLRAIDGAERVDTPIHLKAKRMTREVLANAIAGRASGVPDTPRSHDVERYLREAQRHIDTAFETLTAEGSDGVLRPKAEVVGDEVDFAAEALLHANEALAFARVPDTGKQA